MTTSRVLRRARLGSIAIVGVLAATSCASDGDSTGDAATTATATATADSVTTSTSGTIADLDTVTASGSTGNTSSTTTPRASTSSTSSTSTSTSTSTSSTSTTTWTLPIPDAPGGLLDLDAPMVGLGWTVQGRPLIAERYGTMGGRRVLVIGVIHGDEDDGVAIVDDLRREPVPDGVELWIVESMNPDGQAAQVRHNANAVDLNRNFPYNWGPIGAPGDGQYAGTGPASEPETQAIVGLIGQLRPDITIWYHQDLFVISPAEGREGRIRARYAELTAWPMGGITGGTYTGVAATWARHELARDDGVAFIVELGATLSPEEAERHADAVRTIGVEG